jgi:hypothetical protein
LPDVPINTLCVTIIFLQLQRIARNKKTILLQSGAILAVVQNHVVMGSLVLFSCSSDSTGVRQSVQELFKTIPDSTPHLHGIQHRLNRQVFSGLNHLDFLSVSQYLLIRQLVHFTFEPLLAK